MSDAGLYSGLYEQIRGYAELVDDVLISLKAGTSHPADNERHKLAEFLMSLSSDHRDNFAAQRLLMILRTKVSGQPRWPDLGRALLSETESAQVIPPLESLARSLEDEQVNVTTRMRGATR
jgi:hypothetical protein